MLNIFVFNFYQCKVSVLLTKFKVLMMHGELVKSRKHIMLPVVVLHRRDVGGFVVIEGSRRRVPVGRQGFYAHHLVHRGCVRWSH